MTDRALDAYMQTLQSGFAGIALLLAVAIVLLAYGAIRVFRNQSDQGAINQAINKQAQQNIHDLIELQKTQGSILERATKAAEGTEASLKINNELKAKQVDAFAAQENQLKAIRLDLQKWPEAYTSAVQILTKSVNDLKADIDAAVKATATDNATIITLVQRLESKVDDILQQLVDFTPPPPAMPLALQPDNKPAAEAKANDETNHI